MSAQSGNRPAPAYKAGMIVTHPKRPEWGPGKIVHVVPPKVHVIFRDVAEREAKQIDTSKIELEIAESQSDPILDNLPPLTREGDRWVMARKRLTFDAARQMFLNRYPKGFDDPEYWGDRHRGERNYKLWAHQRYVNDLGDGKAEGLLAKGDIGELTHRALGVVHQTNLLASFEAMALRFALLDRAAAERFFSVLLPLLADERITRERYTSYLEVISALPVKQARVNTWPIATILPYLAQPTRHMFLKPNSTNAAAEVLGFELYYNAGPNWKTYEALLRMGTVYLDLLKPFGARDLIDVQSFIWVTCGSPEQKS